MKGTYRKLSEVKRSIKNMSNAQVDENRFALGNLPWTLFNKGMSDVYEMLAAELQKRKGWKP